MEVSEDGVNIVARMLVACVPIHFFVVKFVDDVSYSLGAVFDEHVGCCCYYIIER